MEPVELSSEGLLLRAWRSDDAAEVYRACQDAHIQRWTAIPVPYLREHAEYFVGHYTLDSWRSETAAPLGIFDIDTGTVLGAHGLVKLNQVKGLGEVGTWVAPWARNRKVAERATRAVVHWALDILGLESLIWRVQVGNHASRLVAARVGFTFDPPARDLLVDRDGSFVDGWRGTLRPGEIRQKPPGWYTPDGIGSRRAHIFGSPQPDLSTRSVRLRAVNAEDIRAITATFSDSQTAQWLNTPLPYTDHDATLFVDVTAPRFWARGEGAVYAITGPDNHYLGSISLLISPDDQEIATLGYVVAPWARGKGYATEAVTTICDWGFHALDLSRIVWQTYVGNTASRRVAEKAGFLMEGSQRQGLSQRGIRRDTWIAGLIPR